MRNLLARLALLAAAAAALAGCGSACQDLAERICNCQPSGVLRDDCKASVGNQIKSGNQTPNASDQERCSELLKTCPDPGGNQARCDELKSEQGKQNCGLAF